MTGADPVEGDVVTAKELGQRSTKEEKISKQAYGVMEMWSKVVVEEKKLPQV